MQKMFKALETSGLRGFLGCKPVLYQSELGQFFDTALVQDEDITGAISDKYFTVTPSRFVGVFELPTEGISNFYDVPKNQVEPPIDDVDVIIGQVISQTPGLTEDDLEQEGQRIDEPEIGDDVDQCGLDQGTGTVGTADTAKFSEIENIEKAGGSKSMDVGESSEQAAGSKKSVEELMSIDDLLFCFTDIVVANLGVERLPDYFLDDFDQGIHTEYFIDFLSDSSVQSDSKIDSESTSGNTVYRSPSPADNSFVLGRVIFTSAQEELLCSVEFPDSPPPTSQRQESTSSASGSPLSTTPDDVPLKDHTEDNETSLPTTSTDLSSAVDDIKSFLAQSIADSENNILHKIQAVINGLRDNQYQQQDFFRTQFHNSRQAIHNDVNTLSVHISEYRKGVQTFGASVNTNNLAIQRKIDAQQAKIDYLDTQVAAIRNNQLEFQTKIAADILSLSTQISDISDFIRSGDAKKGEVGSSSRRPPIRVELRPLPTRQPSPDVQGSGATQLTGGGSAVRTPTFPPTVGTFAERVAMAQRHILESGQVISIEEAVERVIEADIRESDRLERERARERRERRQSRSSSSKRRRGF
ncbi:hypothetical protein F511_43790 [Dorcoceras hygrometricum]|uniref:Uncharacterized protein n=1 Tax=Dorcoceras hygrometricum TaxID=472368 RepID=A0A2Z7BDR7_9LAMI|nr:hypothetical protein F511_43790 [Dorcoceras hygrometricum]